MKRAPELQKFLDEFQLENFGRTATDNPEVCTTCGSSAIGAGDFRDELSVKEFSISHMCQKCQDEIFGS